MKGSKNMKILFAGGGTAGHVTPALAIAEIIKKKYPKCECIFTGRGGGDENKAIINEGYKLYTFDIEGVHRSVSPKNIKIIFKMMRAISGAKHLIKATQPDIIIGTGGYVSLPVVIAGTKLGIPTLLHESNAYPGLVTRKIGKRCTAVMLGMEEARNHLKYKENVLTVGNPTRAGFSTLNKLEAKQMLGIKKGELLIVSFGGSGGADRLNEVMLEVIRKYTSKDNMVRHIHATGKRRYSKIRELAPELCKGKNGTRLIPYIDNMSELLSAADITITRSGAMTLAEIGCVDCVPILIPSPNVAANHQYKNAKAMEERGEAILIEEKALSSELLITILKNLESDSKERNKIISMKNKQSRKECEEKILETIERNLIPSNSATK